MRRVLIIVGKAPRAGHAKTRLVPPLSFEEAADLSRAFLLDTVELGLQLGWDCVSVVHPRGDRELLADLLPRQVRCVDQIGTGLGAALKGAFDQHFAQGFDRVVLIDSDSPTVPVAVIEAASDALHTHDVTIGPSVDGGYYLLGLREPQPRLFHANEWSTSRVFTQTLERVGTLRVHSLEQWYDVDALDDLARLSAELHARPLDVAKHTRAVIARLRLPVSR
jgi:rSAM/selenodomain-associated transferase 1